MKPKNRIEKYGKIRRISVTVLLFTFCSISLLSQELDSIARNTEQPPILLLDDSIVQTEILADTTAKIELEEGHSPRKAMIYSIALPGLGQAYNKKYWKIPIVYAALGGAGYAIWNTTKEYRVALDDYADEVKVLGTSADDRYVRFWRRNMELSYIALVAVDALAVVDAYVDANLFYWDVDPDLTLRVAPAIQPIFNTSGTIKNNYGFKCSLTF